MRDIATRNPQAELIGGLRSEPFKAQIVDALPEGISADRFVRIAITAVQTNPDLAALDVDRDSVIRAFIMCAQVGLLPDGKEAAIVLFGKKATLLPMVGGFRKIAAEHGWTMRGHAIYENDDFEYITEPPAIHHIAVENDRGELRGAWAKATHRDGRIEYKVMYADDILKRREVARSKNVWDGPFKAEMWTKTPVRDLFLELPLDPADKERRERLINAEEFKPNEAVALLYGPSGEEMRVIEQSDATESAPEATEADGGGQGEGGEQPLSMGEGGLGDPGGSTADALPSIDAETKMLADEAGEFVPTNGTYAQSGPKGPQTLAQLYQHDEGRRYLVMLLKRLSEPQEYVDAVWAFCRAYMPEEAAKAEAAKS